MQQLRPPGDLPDFVIIGAGKCGTTALWKELRIHPDICGSRLKETNFFSWQGETKGEDWYRGLFECTTKIKFEASPSYTSILYSDLVPERMHRLIPDAKLVFIVRHPIDRIISRIRHRMRKNEIPVTEFFKIDFWIKGLSASEAITGSQYYRQLTKFLQFYSLQNILIITNEDLRHSPSKVYNEILRIVGLDDTYYSEQFDFIKANVSDDKRRITWNKPHWRLKKLHERGLFPPAHLLFETRVRKPQMPLEIRTLLWSMVVDDLKDFEELVGRNFDYQAPT